MSPENYETRWPLNYQNPAECARGNCQTQVNLGDACRLIGAEVIGKVQGCSQFVLTKVVVNDRSWEAVNETAKLSGVCENTLRACGAAGKNPEYRHRVNKYR